MVFILRRSAYGYERGEKLHLVAWTFEGALRELEHIGLTIGRDGLLVILVRGYLR